MMTPEGIADWADSQLPIYTTAPPGHNADFHNFGYQTSAAPPSHYDRQMYPVAPSLPYSATHHLAPPPHPGPSSSQLQPHHSQFAQYTTPLPRTPQPYPEAHHWPHTNYYTQQAPDGYWSPADSAYDSSSYSTPPPPQLEPVEEEEEETPPEEQRKTRQAKKRKRRAGPGPDDRLEINPGLSRKHNSGHKLLWFFTLELLVDTRQRAVLVWTGQRREFKIVNVEDFRRLWGAHNGRPNVKWDTMERIFRGLVDTVLRPVPTIAHRGRNVPGLYQFITEPSFHLGWTRCQLDAYIEQYADSSHASPPPLPEEPTFAKRPRLVSTTSTATSSGESPPQPPPYPSVQYPTTTTVAQSYQEPPHFPAPGQHV